MKLLLKDKLYNIEETVTENYFTVIANSIEEVMKVEENLTEEALKSFRYIETDELYGYDYGGRIIMGHSKNFEKVKSFFENGLWTKERVYNVVGKKTGITGKEYEEITGVKYE